MHATEERVGVVTAADSHATMEHGRAADDGVEVSIYALAAMVLRKRRAGLAAAAVVVVLGSVLAISAALADETYTVTASFMPERETAPGLGGAAEALSRLGFGVTVGAGGAGSLPYYEDLLKTRSLLEAPASASYRIARESGTGPVTVAELAGYEGTDPEAATEAAVLWLRDRIKVDANTSTGILRFTVTTPDPGLSKALADSILEAVHAHNITRRQFEARGERSFIEGRLADARAELQEAEGRLVGFLRENRQFERSPELLLRFERLQREIDLKQQVMITLAQGFEQARIAEVRNTPSIVVVEATRTPLRPDSRRGPVMWVVWIVLAAGMVGVATAIFAALAERSRESGSPYYREFESALADLKASIAGSRSRA